MQKCKRNLTIAAEFNVAAMRPTHMAIIKPGSLGYYAWFLKPCYFISSPCDPVHTSPIIANLLNYLRVSSSRVVHRPCFLWARRSRLRKCARCVERTQAKARTTPAMVPMKFPRISMPPMRRNGTTRRHAVSIATPRYPTTMPRMPLTRHFANSTSLDIMRPPSFNLLQQHAIGIRCNQNGFLPVGVPDDDDNPGPRNPSGNEIFGGEDSRATHVADHQQVLVKR